MALSLAAAAAAAYVITQPGQIEITSSSATSTREPAVEIRGRVRNHRLKRIFLLVNGYSRPVTVDHGAFKSRVPLVTGENKIQASVDEQTLRLTGTSNAIRLLAQIPASDVWCELGWDGPGDIDLHLYEPDGEQCYYGNKESKAGAILDVDNTERDGPEHVTLNKAIPGEYRVTVLYFAAKGEGAPRKVSWRVALRLRNGASQRTYSGVRQSVGQEQTAAMFRFP